MNHRTPTRPTDRLAGGFTLIEVLIASSILALVVASMVTPLSLAAKHQRIDAKQTVAGSLAMQTAERMLALTSAEVLALNGTRQTGRAITDFTGAALNEASLDGFEVTIAASEAPIAVGSEGIDDAARFVVASVTVTHEDVAPVTASRLFAPVPE